MGPKFFPTPQDFRSWLEENHRQEYEKKIKENKKAWDFFQSLPPSVRKPSIWYIMSAKREDTRLRRLDTLIQCSEEGLRIPPLRRG